MRITGGNLSIYVTILLLGSMFLVSSCKSEFEKLRASGNTQKIYKAANKYYDEGKFLQAQTLYELVLNNYKGKAEAEELYFKYAYTHYYLYEYILASYYFKQYANTFATSPHREEALYMTAYCNYKLSPNYRLDQQYTHDAIDAFQLFVNTFPNSSRLEKCNELIDELRKKLETKAIAAAQLYYDMEDYLSAVKSFEHVLQDFPETNDEEDIRFKMVMAQYQLTKKSVYSKKEERAREVLTLYEIFMDKYPKSAQVKDLNNIKEKTLKIIKDLENDRYKITSSRS